MALRIASRQARLVVFGYNAVTKIIEWARNPEGQQYAGEPLSLSGAQVMAYYKDGTASDITDSCIFEPEEGSILEYGGELTINANYTDHAGNQFTADTQITVADVDRLVFSGISNQTQKEGTSLDLSGATISVRYTDGTSRSLSDSSVTFEPTAGTAIGHVDTLLITATWMNAATGTEYTAEYTLSVDKIDMLSFTHAPNKTRYTEGERLDLTGSTIALKYKRSGDMQTVTSQCSFYPAAGEQMSASAASVHAYYQTITGDQYQCETLLNVTPSTISIGIIGPMIGFDLGLTFNFDLPADFWGDFVFGDLFGEIPVFEIDEDFFIPEDAYDAVVDYLNKKGAFVKYKVGNGGQYGDIPYMVVPAGKYVSADGTGIIEAVGDIYIIAAMGKRNGLPEKLPSPSTVDYPYTNAYDNNQIEVLTFTLNASDYIKCDPGLRGSYNSGSTGICRKMAGLGLPYVTDESMYTNYAPFVEPSIVSIPGILQLPWCWYSEIPHDLATLKSIVRNGRSVNGCKGISHKGKVPDLTYSEDSLYDEVREQFSDVFDSTATYGGDIYVKVRRR